MSNNGRREYDEIIWKRALNHHPLAIQLSTFAVTDADEYYIHVSGCFQHQLPIVEHIQKINAGLALRETTFDKIIMKSNKYITPKKEDIQRRFNEYNKMYFDGRLTPCKIIVTTRSEVCGAVYHRSYNRILISKNAYWTDENLRLTLIHEMVHHYVNTIVSPKQFSFAHGYRFNSVCNKLRKKYGLKVKLHQLPYIRMRGEKEPTILKRLLVNIFQRIFFI